MTKEIVGIIERAEADAIAYIGRWMRDPTSKASLSARNDLIILLEKFYCAGYQGFGTTPEYHLAKLKDFITTGELTFGSEKKNNK